MANHVSLKDIKARAEFIEKAAARFQEDPAIATYGEIEPGSYFAIRWGMDSDCVMVFKLDPDFECEIYGQVIDRTSSILYTNRFKEFTEQLKKEMS